MSTPSAPTAAWSSLPPWALPAKPPELAGMAVPGTGPLAGPRPQAKVFFLCQFSVELSLLIPLPACCYSSSQAWGVSVGLLSPPRAGPGCGATPGAGLGPPHTHSLQVSGPLAELCKQLLPSLSALRLMFEQQPSHPSLWEASSKQIAGGGAIYLGMTGLQSIYSTGNCSLLKCQIDSSSCTGRVRACGGCRPPPFICKEKESLRLIAQLNMQHGKQLFGNYCLCLIMTYRSLTVINFSLELECKWEL